MFTHLPPALLVLFGIVGVLLLCAVTVVIRVGRRVWGWSETRNAQPDLDSAWLAVGKPPAELPSAPFLFEEGGDVPIRWAPPEDPFSP